MDIQVGLFVTLKKPIQNKGSPESSAAPWVIHPGLYLDSELSYATLMDLCKGGPLTVLVDWSSKNEKPDAKEMKGTYLKTKKQRMTQF